MFCIQFEKFHISRIRYDPYLSGGKETLECTKRKKSRLAGQEMNVLFRRLEC
uniref:Uncharacterized protein n=1 Tax=Rhizophora mucronata TaxID=61149 RepID=A0A2P2N3E7_RHIMU